jgi:hypothetical protein
MENNDTPKPANPQPANLDKDKELELLRGTISRFGIEVPTDATPDSIYGTIRKKFVEQVISDEEFKKPIFESGFGQAMGKMESKIKQRFGIQGNKPFDELIEEVSSRQSVDSQELQKAKLIAQQMEAKLNEYEERILPAKIAELEERAKNFEVESALKRELGSMQILGAMHVSVNELLRKLPSKYKVEVVDGKLEFLNKNNTPVNKPNSMIPYTVREIISIVLDEAGLLANNNAPPSITKVENNSNPAGQNINVPIGRDKAAANLAAMKRKRI